jgi:hypothetical protein
MSRSLVLRRFGFSLCKRIRIAACINRLQAEIENYSKYAGTLAGKELTLILHGCYAGGRKMMHLIAPAPWLPRLTAFEWHNPATHRKCAINPIPPPRGPFRLLLVVGQALR